MSHSAALFVFVLGVSMVVFFAIAFGLTLWALHREKKDAEK